MVGIEGIITHRSRNSHLLLTLGRKGAIQSVSEDKQEIPHMIFEVV